jgi:putative YhdH/YhfP family quinone oxidoreductase
MSNKKYKALVVNEKNGIYLRRIETKNISDLPDGEVLINVKYSSLNYKDALSAIGNKGVTRHYPHTPGIDAAGFVIESKSSSFKKGDEVIALGYDLGMNTPGGFGEYIRVPSEWILKLPLNLSLKESMIYGTAGFTAALALIKMEMNGTTPKSGDILITGATGGVGSTATAIFSKLGYNVTASTGKKSKTNFLKKLGAKKVIDRHDVIVDENKSLDTVKWGGVVDSVGGTILESAIKTTKYGCNIATCGLVQSNLLKTTVYPFILRGVNLLGISSMHVDIELKNQIWGKLANEWKPENLDDIYTECSLEELDEKINLILKGKICGRILIKHGN